PDIVQAIGTVIFISSTTESSAKEKGAERIAPEKTVRLASPNEREREREYLLRILILMTLT
ncbi:hypothetical protein IJG89_04205, partial [Candidatus Saccharibacteria bacterium]|nr:hypothetical protein [Candidatus Saccharibacteria bacterium]